MSVNINNKNKKLRNYSHLLCMVLFTLFMCIVYSKRVSVSNDHYASLETYYDFFEYGGDFANLGSRFNIGTILNTFFYYIFGNRPFTALFMSIFPLSLCLFMTSYLVSKDKERVYWISFPILFFLFVPLSGSCDTWLYHQWEALVFLTLIVLYNKFVEFADQKRAYVIGGIAFVLILLYGIFVIGSILVLVYAVLPAVIYICLCFIHNFDVIKKYKLPIMIITGIVVFVLSITGFFNWVYHGYGGSGYMAWTPVNQLWDNLMFSLKYTAESWGIEYGGQPLVQGQALLYSLKYAAFFYAIYLVGFYFVLGLRNKKKMSHSIEFICSACVICNVGANVFGTCVYSLPSRYFSGAHYALAVLLCRHVARWLFSEKEIGNINLGQSIASLLCLSLLFFGLNPRIDKMYMVFPVDAQITEYLVENNLHYGLGDFTNIYSFAPISGGKVEAFSCFAGQDMLQKPWSFPVPYYQGTNQYQFIYDHPGEGNWTEEHINESYEDYISKNAIEGRTIYVYDYDVRWKKIMIGAYGTTLAADEINSSVYKLTPSKLVEYTFELPIGVSRIAINGYNLQDLNVNFLSNFGPVEISDEKIEHNRITYDISCESSTLVKMQLINNTDQDINFKYADIRMVYAAKDLVKDTAIQASKTIEMPITTNDSDVTVIIKCDEAKKLELKAEDNSGIKINKIREGNIQSVYELSGLTEGQKNNLYLTNTSDNEAVIQKISYERNDIHQLYADQYNYDVRIIR